MFDIGFGELVLVSVVALVVLGPERLPHAIRSVTSFVRSARKMANGVKNELTRELEIQELQESLRKAEQKAKASIESELKPTIDGLKGTAQSLQKANEQPFNENSAASNKEELSAAAHPSTEKKAD